jgi:S1-C subfamily serine protease
MLLDGNRLLTQIAATLALLLAIAAGQGTGTLRVRVVLADASGAATPLPRITLLVSDDPPIDEPRRVRTTADGSIELTLRAGSYTVELDEPVGFRGKAYTWSQIVTVTAGRDTVLDLNASNAEEVANARINADSATLLTAWRNSVVEIWTPTRHASGFVVDAAKGLIATSHHAIGEATSVEVQFALANERFKIPGRVIVSERETGAAVVWVNPQVLTSIRAIDLGCARESAVEAGYKDRITTITASMFANKEAADGVVTRKTSQAIFSDMRIGDDSEGGPVFAESGELLGISAIDDDRENPRRWNEAWVVPVEHACRTLASGIKKVADALPPAATRLPIEPVVPAVQVLKASPARLGSGAPAKPARQPATLASSNFDITLIASEQANNDSQVTSGSRTDFGNWSQYVREAGPVMLIRVSPQFEESVWKTIARGAAATQGVMLPPLKSLSANFAQMRAYCGDAEVMPLHPFIIEQAVPGGSPLREGLYVFERNAFGSHCSTIRLSMFSEKSPQNPDTKMIDPKLFEQIKAP